MTTRILIGIADRHALPSTLKSPPGRYERAESSASLNNGEGPGPDWRIAMARAAWSEPLVSALETARAMPMLDFGLSRREELCDR